MLRCAHVRIIDNNHDNADLVVRIPARVGAGAASLTLDSPLKCGKVFPSKLHSFFSHRAQKFGVLSRVQNLKSNLTLAERRRDTRDYLHTLANSPAETTCPFLCDFPWPWLWCMNKTRISIFGAVTLATAPMGDGVQIVAAH